MGCLSCWDFFSSLYFMMDSCLGNGVLPEGLSPLLIPLFEFHSTLEMCFSNRGQVDSEDTSSQMLVSILLSGPHSNLLSLPWAYSLLIHCLFLCFCVLFCHLLIIVLFQKTSWIFHEEQWNSFKLFRGIFGFVSVFVFWMFSDNSDFIFPLS